MRGLSISIKKVSKIWYRLENRKQKKSEILACIFLIFNLPYISQNRNCISESWILSKSGLFCHFRDPEP